MKFETRAPGARAPWSKILATPMTKSEAMQCNTRVSGIALCCCCIIVRTLAANDPAVLVIEKRARFEVQTFLSPSAGLATAKLRTVFGTFRFFFVIFTFI